MNKSGIIFNVIVTFIGIVQALASVTSFEKYASIFAIALVIGNVIIHVWFPSQAVPVLGNAPQTSPQA
jgi:hypothetical protein